MPHVWPGQDLEPSVLVLLSSTAPTLHLMNGLGPKQGVWGQCRQEGGGLWKQLSEMRPAIVAATLWPFRDFNSNTSMSQYSLGPGRGQDRSSLTAGPGSSWGPGVKSKTHKAATPL